MIESGKESIILANPTLSVKPNVEIIQEGDTSV